MGCPAEDSTEVLVWYSPTRDLLRHPGVRAARRRAREARQPRQDRRRRQRPDHPQRRSCTRGRRSSSPSIRSGSRRTARSPRGRPRRAGFGVNTQTGRRRPISSPDFVYESKGQLTPSGTRSWSGFPSAASSTSRSTRRTGGSTSSARCSTPGTRTPGSPTRAGRGIVPRRSPGRWSGSPDLHRGLVLDLNPFVTEKALGAPAASPRRDGGTASSARSSAPTCGGASRTT